LDWLELEVVPMLAEIFIVQLETAVRVSQDAATSSNSRFVPFTGGGQLVFKDSGKRLVEPERGTAPPAPGVGRLAAMMRPLRFY
jgi:hypothetical protein